MAYGALEALAAGYNGRLREDLSPKPATLLAGVNAGQRTQLSREQFNAQMQELAQQQQARAKVAESAPAAMQDLVRTPQGFNAYAQYMFSNRGAGKPQIFGNAESGYFALGDGGVQQLVAGSGGTLDGPLEAVIGEDGRPVLVPRAEAVGMTPASARDDKSFGQANQLRTQVNTLAKPYREVAQSYDKVRAGLELGTGAGDTAAIFGYAKILDPNSVVRESEFAQMQNVGGAIGYLSALYNRAASGQLLTPSQRAQILQGAQSQLVPQRAQYDAIVGSYSQIAEGLGLKVEDVITPIQWPDVGGDIQTQAEAPKEPNAFDGLSASELFDGWE